MDEDERFSAVLHRAVSTLEPPTQRLVSGAIARGRRRRRWIRGAEVGTTAVVLAGVAGLVVALIPARGSGPATVPPAGPVHRTTTPAKPVKSLPATVAVTPQALLQIALDTLPRPGKTSHYAGHYFNGGAVFTQFDYDDGHGAAQIYVAMSPAGVNSGDGSACRAGTTGCTVLADGAHAMFRSYKEYSDERTPNATNWVVNLFRRDGVVIDIYEFNAPQEKGAQLTRATPPFRSGALIKWADNPRFTTRVSATVAKASASLFKPVNLDAPPVNSGVSVTQERRNCEVAKQIHKTPPPYCAKLS